MRTVDIVLLDLEMPELDGTEFLTALSKQETPRPKVVIFSRSLNPTFLGRLRTAGIDGYLLKSEGLAELAQALSALQRGETYFSPAFAKQLWLAEGKLPTREPLTEREMQIARLISQGYSTNAIADTIGCAPSTIKTHRINLMRKLEAKNSAEVARWVTTMELNQQSPGF